MEVVIKKGDTRPFDASIKANGNAVNVTGATVRFNMVPKLPGIGSTVARAMCTILDGPKGLVRYAWQAADVDTAGDHRAEFEVTFGDGTVESFPNGEYIDLRIVNDLG